ncbi:MAG: ATP synthase F0 subunit B [Bdellovibrionaceae bacterium]|nr:ATP synthase F0 subunit B [Pseudobdellovibrionaceae bacterium]
MFILFISIFTFPFFAEAASGAHGGIPWGLIISQVVNFSLLIILVKIFLKKPLAVAIKTQKDHFLSEEASANKKANETKVILQQWQDKWQQLSRAVTQKIEEAKAHSAQMSEEQIASANAQAAHILKKSKSQIQAEVLQAKNHLAELLLHTACEKALDNQKTQGTASSINLSLLKNKKETKNFNEKN